MIRLKSDEYQPAGAIDGARESDTGGYTYLRPQATSLPCQTQQHCTEPGYPELDQQKAAEADHCEQTWWMSKAPAYNITDGASVKLLDVFLRKMYDRRGCIVYA